MIQKAGFDLVWFGIFIVLPVEIAEVTPPVGFNLFVLQNMTGKDSNTIAKAAIPFFACLVVCIVSDHGVPTNRHVPSRCGDGRRQISKSSRQYSAALKKPSHTAVAATTTTGGGLRWRRAHDQLVLLRNADSGLRQTPARASPASRRACISNVPTTWRDLSHHPAACRDQSGA
jgi:hypothetical protein